LFLSFILAETFAGGEGHLSMLAAPNAIARAVDSLAQR
jgi:hypothetical protein